MLTRHDGRRRLLARLGPEAEDGIDELLAQALAYEQSEVPSLTGFLAWMDTDDIEVKRQLDSEGHRDPGDDGAWRQGAGGADRDPARHRRPQVTPRDRDPARGCWRWRRSVVWRTASGESPATDRRGARREMTAREAANGCGSCMWR